MGLVVTKGASMVRMPLSFLSIVPATLAGPTVLMQVYGQVFLE